MTSVGGDSVIVARVSDSSDTDVCVWRCHCQALSSHSTSMLLVPFFPRLGQAQLRLPNLPCL